MKNKEIEELLDYYQKEIDKYEETKQYLMGKYGYDEETIDNISQHQRYKNNKLLLSYIEQLEKENEKTRMRNDMLRKDIDSFIKDNKIDYKSRIDKAIEYIEIELSQGGERELRDLVDGYEVLKLLKGDSE